MENMIEIKGLCRDYGDFCLRDVDLVVPGGTIMGLIGENGAGKSTTMRAMLNLIHRDGGSIRVLGRDIDQDDPAFKEEIGVVLDDIHFHDSLTAQSVGRILSGVYRNWDAALYEGYLTRFQLPARKKLKTFSKGMKMKLSVATALSHHPKLLILDEATSGLDPVVRNELLDEFLAFIQDDEHAVLLSSHITSDLEKVSDYITYLHRGRVAVQGPKDELLDHYGRLVCAKGDLETVDATLLTGVQKGPYGAQALVKDRAAFARQYPDLVVEPATLEDIMLFTVKEDAG